MSITRTFASVDGTRLHYVSAGDPSRPTVLLLHQTPRSWREYGAVVPLLARHWHVMALDTPGFGDSEATQVPATIEAWATIARRLLQQLAIAPVHLVGHHTGGVVAVELAAQYGSAVRSLLLSSTPLVDEPARESRRHHPHVVDAVQVQADGSHLAGLWQQRAAFYPRGRPELLQAFVADALKVSYPIEEGHRAVAHYEMEKRLHLLQQPLCVFHAAGDPFAQKYTAQWTARFPQAQVVVFDDGMVPLPDQLPERFASAVDRFLMGVESACASAAG